MATPTDPLTPLLQLIADGKITPDQAARQLLRLPPGNPAADQEQPAEAADRPVVTADRPLADRPANDQGWPVGNPRIAAGNRLTRSGHRARQRLPSELLRHVRNWPRHARLLAAGTATLGMLTTLLTVGWWLTSTDRSQPVGSPPPAAATQPPAQHAPAAHIAARQTAPRNPQPVTPQPVAPPTKTPASELPSEHPPKLPQADDSLLPVDLPLPVAQTLPPVSQPLPAPAVATPTVVPALPAPTSPARSPNAAATDIPTVAPLRHGCAAVSERFEWPLAEIAVDRAGTRLPVSLATHGAATATPLLALDFPATGLLDTQWIQPLPVASSRGAAQRKLQSVLQWTLPAAPYPAIRCHIEARLGSRLQLRLRYAAQLAADQPWQPFSTAELTHGQDHFAQQMSQQTAALSQLQQQYRIATRNQKTALRPQRDALEQSITQLQTTLQQLQQLAILHATVLEHSPLAVQVTAGPDRAAPVLFATSEPTAR